MIDRATFGERTALSSTFLWTAAALNGLAAAPSHPRIKGTIV